MLELHASVLTCVQRDPVTLLPHQSVGEALDQVRAHGTNREVLYLYVVDESRTLIGVVPTRALLSAAVTVPIADIMFRDVVAIPEWATVLVAAEYFVSKKFLAFPVVSRHGELLGHVDVSVFTDEVISHARRSFDDIFQIIGVHATQGRTAWSGFLDRFPWLLTNVAGGMLCAWLASQYEGLLDAVIVLALFIPCGAGAGRECQYPVCDAHVAGPALDRRDLGACGVRAAPRVRHRGDVGCRVWRDRRRRGGSLEGECRTRGGDRPSHHRLDGDRRAARVVAADDVACGQT